MTVEKAELRAAAIHDVGCSIEDLLEGANTELHRAEGGQKVAQKAMERTVQIIAAVDKELEEGALPDIETAQHVKRYIGKIHGAMKDLFKESTQTRLAASGMVAGLAKAVDVTNKLKGSEAQKGERHADPGANGKSNGVGGRISIKQRRQQEEAAAAAGGAEKPEEPAAEPEPQPGAETAEKPAKPTPKRRPKKAPKKRR